jgi:hypothetical protein
MNLKTITDRVRLQQSRLQITTVGLKDFGLKEVVVEVNNADLLPEADSFLRFVMGYMADSGRQIFPGETIAYGYWLIKFEDDGGSLAAWEYEATATQYVAGASLCLRYWRDQHATCSHYQAVFSPPRPDRLTVVDEGVLEGLPVQAVRYPSPEHMSGWWITTDRYNGDTASLRREHTYHVTAARPELAPYIALPHGFRFNLGRSYVDAWFDERVALEPATP